MLFFGKKRDINLIPEEEQKARINKVRIVTLAAVAVLIGLQLLFFGALSVLQSREQGTSASLVLESTQQNAQWQKVASNAAKLKSVKQKFVKYQSFSEKYFVMEGRIELVKSVIPSGATLEGLEIDQAGSVKFRGTAESPAIILQLLNVLSKRQDNFKSTLLSSAEKIGDGNGYSFTINTVVEIQ